MLDTSKNNTSAPPAQYGNSTNGQRTAGEVAARFSNAKPNGDGWLIPCPCHQDDKPSLSIRDTDKGIWVHCFAGCTEGEGWRDVKRKLEIYKEYTRWDPSANIVAVYQHPDGLLRTRYRQDHDGPCWRDDCSKSGKHKHIWGEKGRSSSGCYLLTWGDDAPGKTLCIVEGEKAAAALLDHVDGKDYTPVTWNGGASVTKSVFDVVDGRDVILWPDNDGPGKRAMNHAALSALDAGAETVRLVDVATLSKKADAADVDADTALALLQSATLYEPETAHGGTREGAGRPAKERPAGNWVMFTKDGSPLRSSIENAKFGLSTFSDCQFTFDEFSGREYLNGEKVQDADAIRLRARMERELSFAPTKEAMHAAITDTCNQNRFHPIRDWLESLEWDGKLRLSKFGQIYFGSEPTPLANATGRLILLGMAGRIFRPGHQYDYCVVLQGKQGTGKSSALRILAGLDYHTDSIPLSGFDHAKTVLERTNGIWLVELSELAGAKFAEIEAVKAMISGRREDAREAYGHFKTEQERQFIFAATTNSTEFLVDRTGNRRFPVVQVDIGEERLRALERDREQLFAEAVQEVHKIFPHPITLPRGLWEEAAAHSEEFRTVTAFEDWLTDYLVEQSDPPFVYTKNMRSQLAEDLPGKVFPYNKELGEAMRRAGFERDKKSRQRRWIRAHNCAQAHKNQ